MHCAEKILTASGSVKGIWCKLSENWTVSGSLGGSWKSWNNFFDARNVRNEATQQLIWGVERSDSSACRVFFPLLFLYHFFPSFSSSFSQSYFALLFAVLWYIKAFYCRLDLVPSKIAVIQETLICKTSSTNCDRWLRPLCLEWTKSGKKIIQVPSCQISLKDLAELGWFLYISGKLHFTITRTTQKTSQVSVTSRRPVFQCS